MSDPDVDEETPIFAIAVAAVAIVGGMWNVITTGGPSPTSITCIRYAPRSTR
jgi:hypothetical protein